MDFEYFIRKIGFEEEDINTLVCLYDKVKYAEAFKGLVNEMRAEPLGDIYDLRQRIYGYASVVNAHPYTMLLTVLCSSADVIKDRMIKSGSTEAVYWDTVRDFRYKAYECKRMHGVIGIFIIGWYRLLYEGRRFELGRLQFEIIGFPMEKYSKGNTVITKGMPIINVHIPSSGRLDIEDVKKSLKAATEFFTLKYDGKFFFFCESWLLYPKYKSLFKVSKNITDFASLFDIFDTIEQEKFEDGWRIFNTEELSDINKLPNDTSLRCAFIEYMKNGGSFGSGCGMICIQ